jgi:hypothetical protein
MMRQMGWWMLTSLRAEVGWRLSRLEIAFFAPRGSPEREMTKYSWAVKIEVTV